MSSHPLVGTRHAAFHQRLRDYVDRRIKPRAESWEHEARCPRAALLAFGRAGFVSLDPWRNALLAEELPCGDSLGFALAVFVQANLVAPLLKRLSSARQRAKWLTPLLQGQRLGAMAVSEPEAGSDVASINTTAARTPDGFVLNGEKTYITVAAVADLLIVAARTDPEASHHALSLFVVPTRTRGVEVRPLRLLGLNTSGAAAVRLTAVRVSREALLGREGDGFAWVLDGLSRERLFGGLAVVAWADHALARARSWARERMAFGSRLSAFQAVRHRFAELASSLEAARQLNYAIFRRWVEGHSVTKETAMIKLFSYRVATEAIDACVQIHGGAGYLESHWSSRYYRDARALSIAAGVPEVMKDLIAAHLKW
jgi:alkylation response protein AidB-like acyl-CoA dehydrogenase